MPSTYTNRLRIEQQGTGENSGTWGGKLNTTLNECVEEAIAGIATVALADANYTLTTANGATDEARRAIIVLTGALTTSRNITCPTQQKLYVVFNNTSGGQSIVFKTAAGSGVTVLNGKKRLVYCDGTNVVDMVNDLPSGTTLAGSTIYTSGTTALANYVADPMSAGELASITGTFGTAAFVADSTLMHLAGTETVSGVKTFSAQQVFEGGLRLNQNDDAQFRSGASDYLAIGNDGTNTYFNRLNNAGVYQDTPLSWVNGVGNPLSKGFLIYHAGNLPGTAITWTAAQTFSLDNVTNFNRTTTTAFQIQLSTLGAARGYLGADATYSLRAYNSGGSEVFNTTSATGVTNFLFAPTVNGSTIYTAANLPGTAITWTAQPVFTAGARVTQGGVNVDTVGAAGVGYFGTQTNHPLVIRTNDAEVARFLAGGGMTIGGNTAYHAGNLPGTNITWTGGSITQSSAACQWISYETDGPADSKRWNWYVEGGAMYLVASNDAASVFNNFLQFQRTGATPNFLTMGSGVSIRDAGGTPYNIAGKQAIPIPANSFTPRTTNGAAVGLTETATNKLMIASLDFDQTTVEYASYFMAMPKSWNESTISAQFIWTAASTGAVVWGLRAVAISDDDVLDATMGTAAEVTDTVTAANDLMISAETGAITVGGTPTEGDLVFFELYRQAGSGSDTLAADAKLIAVRLFITTNAANDA